MIITIARQCGCGAVNVGRMLSERFGVPFYTRKNLMEMAAARGLSNELADFFEERPVDELLFAMSSFGEERTLVTERPLRSLAAMIGSEDCIIIGRCGNYIFRRRDDLISVFLGGDVQARIANIEREERMSRAHAREFVEQSDDCRAAYHRYYTGLTWGNAADYDLCLDSVRLGTAAAADLVARYVGLTLKNGGGL